jgi:serine/threonine protein kinase
MGSQYAFPVDVWSLGVLAFMLLSGCAPFDTSDAQLEERQVCTRAAAAASYYSLLSTQYSVLSTQYSVLSTQYSVLSTYLRQVCLFTYASTHSR